MVGKRLGAQSPSHPLFFFSFIQAGLKLEAIFLSLSSAGVTGLSYHLLSPPFSLDSY